MFYNIELLLPSANPGAASQTETLGPCRIISRNIFVTVTEKNGDAHLVLLDELTELDRTAPRYVSTNGRTFYPKRLDLPDRIMVETPGGYARTILGDQVARMKATTGRR